MTAMTLISTAIQKAAGIYHVLSDLIAMFIPVVVFEKLHNLRKYEDARWLLCQYEEEIMNIFCPLATTECFNHYTIDPSKYIVKSNRVDLISLIRKPFEHYSRALECSPDIMLLELFKQTAKKCNSETVYKQIGYWLFRLNSRDKSGQTGWRVYLNTGETDQQIVSAGIKKMGFRWMIQNSVSITTRLQLLEFDIIHSHEDVMDRLCELFFKDNSKSMIRNIAEKLSINYIHKKEDHVRCLSVLQPGFITLMEDSILRTFHRLLIIDCVTNGIDCKNSVRLLMLFNDKNNIVNILRDKYVFSSEELIFAYSIGNPLYLKQMNPTEEEIKTYNPYYERYKALM